MEAWRSGDLNLLGVRDRAQYVNNKPFDVFSERFRLVRGVCWVLMDVLLGPGLGNKPS